MSDFSHWHESDLDKIQFDLDDADQIESSDLLPIDQYKSEKICAMIVCNKYFNINKDMTVSYMQELSKRRIAGDPFDFESFIDKSFNDLPKISFEVPDLRTMLNDLITKVNKK